LAGKSTLNRLERTPAEADEQSRYHKIVYDEEWMSRCFVDIFDRVKNLNQNLFEADEKCG